MPHTEFTLVQVAVTVAALGVTLGLSVWLRLEIGRDLLWGIGRSFVQLLVVGYFLGWLIGTESVWTLVAVPLAMVVIGAQTSSKRAAPGWRAIPAAAAAIAAGGVTSTAILVLVGTIPMNGETGLPRFQYLIPLAGILIGSAMQAASQAFERFSADVARDQSLIEAALTEGATRWQAVGPTSQVAIRAALVQPIDRLKVMGTVVLPGAAVGMIVAGADPLQAVLLQMIVAYMLLFTRTVTVFLAVLLVHPLYFDPAGNLRTGYLEE